VLPWTPAAREWQARLCAVSRWLPEEAWPDLSDDALLRDLESWLAPWLDGISRLDHLKRLDLPGILRNRLDWRRQQELESLAPTHIRVPSGSLKRLAYPPGEAPVLAVRLQEMFGLLETPTVCRGRVPVMLHLLSPAQRPIQITQDLEGFWARTYSEVKKELKGRYPKHYWPDDPLQARATSAVRPRN
jgi:ATP-dependent helicase HrpB